MVIYPSANPSQSKVTLLMWVKQLSLSHVAEGGLNVSKYIFSEESSVGLWKVMGFNPSL